MLHDISGDNLMDNLREFLGSRLGLIVTVPLAMLGAYLLWTHTDHVLSAVLYVILLACPLLHLFGHGHGHGNRHSHQPDHSPQDPRNGPAR